MALYKKANSIDTVENFLTEIDDCDSTVYL